MQAQENITLIDITATSLTFEINDPGKYDFFIRKNDENLDYRMVNQIEYREGSNIISIGELTAASIYAIKILKDGQMYEEQLYCTQSNSSGEIRHYFNHPIPSGQSGDLMPTGTTFNEVEKAIRDAIKAAKNTIDYCAYNSNVTSIINALIDAHSRGVRVRVIADNSTSNTGLNGSLPFEVLYDGDEGLMHNKFISIDSDNAANALLIAGSMNLTIGQMTYDPNHLIFIQDQAIAKTYSLEFEEMWGSNSAKADKAKSKFGAKKTDNTPHIFNVSGIPIEVYFSPSDNTSTKIKSKLRTANTTVDLSLLLFTYNELQNTIIDNLASNVRVNGIIDDAESSKDVIKTLNDAGANLLIDKSGQIYHYKMAMIDADDAASKPYLLTGSHNWTFSAETKNDENLIIIQDHKITNLYKRAMYYWWNQLTANHELLDLQPIDILFDGQSLHINNDAYWLGSEIFVADILGRPIIQHKITDTHSDLFLNNFYPRTFYAMVKKDGRYYSIQLKHL